MIGNYMRTKSIDRQVQDVAGDVISINIITEKTESSPDERHM